MALSSIIIEGNNIAPSVINGGNGPVLKTYSAGMFVSGDASISNNSISGIRAGGVHIALLSGSSIVSNNYFARGTTPIGAYISVASTADQIITNNTFDSPTVDGTSEALVTGLTSGSIYDKNKNQTKFVSYYMGDAQYTPPGDPAANYLAFGSNGGYNFLKVNMFSSAAGSLQYIFSVNFNNIVPSGVQILTAAISCQILTGTNTNFAGTNNITAQALRLSSSLNSPSNTLTNPNSQSSTSLDSPVVVNLPDQSSFYTLKSDFSNSSTSYLVNNNELYYNILVNLTTNATPSTTAKYQLSTLIIKYRY